ncbi:MAG: sulfite exporter TauE/SafE family protein [Paracoccaceae bacterium]
MDISTLQYIYIGLAAFLIGFSKTSIEVGILAVLLLAMVFPGKASPGVVLPMLIAADIIAVIYYRRSCQWHVLVKLIPASAVGVLAGAVILWALPDLNFERVIGWIILAMLVFDLTLTSAAKQFIRGGGGAAGFGIVGGASSMIANAAGPVFGIYLLQMGLNKVEFVGTRSWFFLIMNVAKLPFAIGLGLVTPQTLTLDAMAFPMILLGAVSGYVFLRLINPQVFTALIRMAVLVAAFRLIFF